MKKMKGNDDDAVSMFMDMLIQPPQNSENTISRLFTQNLILVLLPK